MANDKIKVTIRALVPLSIGDGRILQIGDSAEIERTQAAIDEAKATGLYEVLEGEVNETEVPANG